MKNTLILILSKFFEKGVMFLFFVLLAQHFGKESFGVFSYYFAIASMLFVLFDVGGEFYQIREFTKRESLRVFQNIFILKSIIASSVIFIALFTQQNIYLLILIFSFYLDSIVSIFRSSLYKNALYYQESILTLIEKGVLITVVFFNILVFNNILVMYLSFVVAKLVYLVLASKKFYNLKYLASSFKLFDFHYFKKYTVSSWSYILHALLVVVFVQIDILMLKWMGVPFEEIGLYSAAIKIYMAVVIFADILFKQYYPKISHLINIGEVVGLRTLALKIQSMNIYASLFFSFITMLFAHEIIGVSFGPEFSESSNMLILLSVIIVFRFSMYTYTALLSASAYNSIKLITSLTWVFGNVGLNYMLIPKHGVYGALVATVITEFVLVVMYKISSLKVSFINIITIKEVVSLSIILLCAYSLSLYELEVPFKLLITVLAILAFSIYTKQIKNTLEFTGMK